MSTSTKSSVPTTRVQRRQAEREQKKLMNRLKMLVNQQEAGANQPDTSDRPKLSKLITDYATPLYGNDASEDEMMAILNLVCSAWNLGRLSKDEQAELWPMMIAPVLAAFTDPSGSLHTAVEKIIAASTMDHGDDPRFVIHYTLAPLDGDMNDKLHLQVASQPLSADDYKSYIMRRMTKAMEA